MPPLDLAIPVLPSRSVTDTLAFYRRLGFDGTVSAFPYSYLVLRRGAVELHFFTHEELKPAESNASCYLRVADVEKSTRRLPPPNCQPRASRASTRSRPSPGV